MLIMKGAHLHTLLQCMATKSVFFFCMRQAVTLDKQLTTELHLQPLQHTMVMKAVFVRYMIWAIT